MAFCSRCRIWGEARTRCPNCVGGAVLLEESMELRPVERADGQYDEQDWSDIPAAAQKAAKVLGFTQQMWDDNEWPAAVEEAEWEDITGEKKKALHVLGYNKWDWE